MTASAQPSVVLDALPAALRERYAGWTGLGAAIEGWRSAAQQAWPALAVPPARFLAHVAARLPDAPPQRAAEQIRAADLYLACACLHGDPAAIEAFRARYLERVLGPLRRLDATTGLAEEIRDRLAQELLVGAPERLPRLHDYAGRGDLWGWLRITALRAAIKHRRRQGREVAVEQSMLDALAGSAEGREQGSVDPELRALKTRFRGNFKAAFEEAFTALSVRERNVLAQHHLDGLTTEQLGALYRVHRVTVSRWLSRARGTLLSRTRGALMQRLDLTPSECDSVIRIVQSQLDLTLERMISPADG